MKKRIKKKVTAPPKNNESENLLRRIELIEEEIELLKHKAIHQEPVERADPKTLSAKRVVANLRYIPSTEDGWILVLAGEEKISLPSGLEVSLDRQSGGRDFITVQEGMHIGRSCDLKSGFLVGQSPRSKDVSMKVSPRQGGPVVIGGKSYDLEIMIKYSENGHDGSTGPFPAMTHPQNPIPKGEHAIELPDYPHDLGSKYGRFGTVWFRVGHSGDRYVHPGRLSDGCLTCAPPYWPQIYDRLIKGRDVRDKKTVGHLTVT